MSWVRLIAHAVLIGLAAGLVADIVRRGWRSTGRLDPVPLAAALVVPAVAAWASPTDGLGALIVGSALLPLAGFGGAVLAAVLADPTEAGVRTAARSPAHGALAALPAVLVLAAADGVLGLISPDGPRSFGPDSGGVSLRGQIVVTWLALLAAVGAVAAVALSSWLLRRGPLARAWRTWRADPELLALSGVESRRLLAVIGALGAAAGAVVGLAGASAATEAPASAWPFGVVVAAVLVAIGLGERVEALPSFEAATTRQRLGPAVVGMAVGIGVAVVDRQRPGWGLAAVAVAALVVAWFRAWVTRRRSLTGVVW